MTLWRLTLSREKEKENNKKENLTTTKASTAKEKEQTITTPAAKERIIKMAIKEKEKGTIKIIGSNNNTITTVERHKRKERQIRWKDRLPKQMVCYMQDRNPQHYRLPLQRKRKECSWTRSRSNYWRTRRARSRSSSCYSS